MRLGSEEGHIARVGRPASALFIPANFNCALPSKWRNALN